MEKIFENPANGYREKITYFSGLWGALLGPIYFATKGIWGHAVAMFLLLSLGVMTGPGIIVAILIVMLWGINAFSILEKYYLRKGWKEVQNIQKSNVSDEIKIEPSSNNNIEKSSS